MKHTFISCFPTYGLKSSKFTWQTRWSFTYSGRPCTAVEMQISDKYPPSLKTKQWFVPKVSRAWPPQQQGWLAAAPGGSPRTVLCARVDQTASLRRQSQTRVVRSPGPSVLVLNCGLLSQKGVRRVGRLWGENEDSSSHILPWFLSLLGLYCSSYRHGDERPTPLAPRCRPPPTHAQTRAESRSREETRKERSGCFKLSTAVPTRRWSWRRRRGALAEARGSARRGAPGRWARARCGPSRGRRSSDAYFSRSLCGRGDPAGAEERRDSRIGQGFRVRRPSSRRDRVPPRSAAAAPNFGQRRPGWVPRASQVRSRRLGCPREPGDLQPRAPGAKSGSESWIPAPLGATSAAPGQLPVPARPQGAPPSPRWPRPHGVPGPWKPPFSSAVGAEITDPQVSAASARVWQRQESPGARAPSGASSRALPWLNPWSAPPLFALGSGAPCLRTHYGSSLPLVGPPGPAWRQCTVSSPAPELGVRGGRPRTLHIPPGLGAPGQEQLTLTLRL